MTNSTQTNTTQNHDDELRAAYRAYSTDHDQQREALMDRIAQENFVSWAPSSRPTSSRMRLFASLAAVLVLALTTSLIIILPQHQIYGMEGLADRLIEVRSLYMSGRQTFDIIDENGDEVRKSFPYWCYLERPNRFCANAFSREYPAGNAPTKVKEYIDWVDEGAQGQKDVSNNQISWLTNLDQRQCELEVEDRMQSKGFLKLISNAASSFKKIDSERRNGMDLDVYEQRLHSVFEDSYDVAQVWLDRSTGLPVSYRSLSIDQQGQEKEDMLIDKIEINKHDSKDVFPSIAGATATPVSTQIRPQQSAGGDNSSLGTWYALQLNDHRILACWMTKQTDAKAEATPKFIGTIGDQHIVISSAIVQSFSADGDQWTWSLLKLPEDLDINTTSFSLQQTVEGSFTSLHVTPLKFAPERLEAVLKNMQELTVPTKDLPVLTLDQVLKY